MILPHRDTLFPTFVLTALDCLHLPKSFGAIKVMSLGIGTPMCVLVA